ncbi:MAG: QacE family quaternary ammonium compound efflux SMR transporter [Acidimicrobiia bacterium]|nr:QacE family quaternary ammonium compound efflux SMR transporter [Acidimicrobiia bacterium]
MIVLGASIAFAVGGAFMKSADGFTRLWPSVAVVVLFIVGAVLLAQAVRVQGLSTAYAVGLGLEAVVSVALGRWLFGEQLSVSQLAGVGLILAGVAGVRFG